MPSTSNPWIRDATGGGVINGGDVGGDVQVTDSFSVRFNHRTLPNAFVTYTYYGASNDVNEAGPPWHVDCQTEFLVCRDPKDPGGTEVWSDYFYGPPSDQAGYEAVAEFTDLAEVKQAAKAAAEAHLVCEETWSGQPPWMREWETRTDELPVVKVVHGVPLDESAMEATDEMLYARARHGFDCSEGEALEVVAARDAERFQREQHLERLQVIEVLLAAWEADALTIALPDGSDEHDRKVAAGEIDDMPRVKDLIVDNLLDQVLEALSVTDEMSLLARAGLRRSRPFI